MFHVHKIRRKKSIRGFNVFRREDWKSESTDPVVFSALRLYLLEVV